MRKSLDSLVPLPPGVFPWIGTSVVAELTTGGTYSAIDMVVLLIGYQLFEVIGKVAQGNPGSVRKRKNFILQQTVLSLLPTGFVYGTVRDPTTVCVNER